jgi:hypothetical protein
MRALLASLFVLAVAGSASASSLSAPNSTPSVLYAANVWTAPDSTRPAPWGGRAVAPLTTIPLNFVYTSPRSYGGYSYGGYYYDYGGSGGEGIGGDPGGGLGGGDCGCGGADGPGDGGGGSCDGDGGGGSF